MAGNSEFTVLDGTCRPQTSLETSPARSVPGVTQGCSLRKTQSSSTPACPVNLLLPFERGTGAALPSADGGAAIDVQFYCSALPWVWYLSAPWGSTCSSRGKQLWELVQGCPKKLPSSCCVVSAQRAADDPSRSVLNLQTTLFHQPNRVSSARPLKS